MNVLNGILIVLVTCAAAGHPAANSDQGGPLAAVSPRPVVVVGTLTDEGVECQTLRADDDRLYTLTGNLRGFMNGDRVWVVGRPAEFSVCQQGVTLNVSLILKVR